MAVVHELSWSVSRHGTFEACRRRYYYDYYYSWGGWDRRAAEGRQKAYLLKKMTRLPMLAGDALHQALAGWFEAKRSGRELRASEVEERALAILREGYRVSRDGVWRQRPSKLTRLAEHHYGEPDIDEASGAATEYGKRFVERIQSGVKHFFEHPELAPARDADPSSYLACEELGTIELHGTKAYAVPDFALRDGEGLVRIYDWKSGAPRDPDRFQLAVYVLYARAKWGSEPESVVCADAYLTRGEVRTERFTRDELERIRETIARSLDAMRGLHFDADRGEGDAERFPMLADPAHRECASCNYRELCAR